MSKGTDKPEAIDLSKITFPPEYKGLVKADPLPGLPKLGEDPVLDEALADYRALDTETFPEEPDAPSVGPPRGVGNVAQQASLEVGGSTASATVPVETVEMRGPHGTDKMRIVSRVAGRRAAGASGRDVRSAASLPREDLASSHAPRGRSPQQEETRGGDARPSTPRARQPAVVPALLALAVLSVVALIGFAVSSKAPATEPAVTAPPSVSVGVPAPASANMVEAPIPVASAALPATASSLKNEPGDSRKTTTIPAPAKRPAAVLPVKPSAEASPSIPTAPRLHAREF